MKSEPLKRESDLSAVFGPTDPVLASAVYSILSQVNDRFSSLRDELSLRTGEEWFSEGLRLESFPTGKAAISDYVENSELTFWIELWPEPSGWPQAVPSSWVADARVSIISEDEIDDTQQVAFEIDERTFGTPQDAAMGLSELAEEWSELALSRPQTAAAWRR